jgi:hypothetical protein
MDITDRLLPYDFVSAPESSFFSESALKIDNQVRFQSDLVRFASNLGP